MRILEENAATSDRVGAFGVVTVNGKQEALLPVRARNDAGHGQIAVVDVGVSGSGFSDAGVRHRSPTSTWTSSTAG